MGPLVKAAALALHHDFGIPQRKVPAVIESMTGLRVTQGALTQWAEGGRGRGEGKAGEVAECLAAAVRRAPVVNTDDTGWRIGGEQGWLMVVVTPGSTVFRIRRRHRSDEVLEIVPRDYAGVMGTDRGASYDAHVFDGVRQSKCVAHLFRSLDDAMTSQPAAAMPVTVWLRDIFERALALWRDRRDGRIVGDAFAQQASELRAELDHALRPRRLKNRDNRRIVGELAWHNRRGSLLRFLDDPVVEPTNNRAERALRPAVIPKRSATARATTVEQTPAPPSRPSPSPHAGEASCPNRPFSPS
ncbi:MAG: transposase [Candidatus Sumerlaeota bacterium]|nr:transposase [Candidatus Sumerlaeota bacterium]